MTTTTKRHNRWGANRTYRTAKRFVRRSAPAGVATLAATLLVVGILPATVGSGITSAANGATPAANWNVGDPATSGELASVTLPGVANPVEYAFGLSYAGAASAPGSAITGQGTTLKVLQGDTLTGSAAAWSTRSAEAETSTAPEVAVVPGEGAAQSLSRVLTHVPAEPTAGGIGQARWQIAAADASVVNAGNGMSASPLHVLSEGEQAATEVFVVSPQITATLEVSSTGDGDWATDLTVPADFGDVTYRVTAVNSGNVDLEDITVATATRNETEQIGDAVGVTLGDIAVGESASATFVAPAGAGGTTAATVSGTFTGDAPDGAPLAQRFTDAAGVKGRVPSNTATATIDVAPSAEPPADDTMADDATPKPPAEIDTTDESVSPPADALAGPVAPLAASLNVTAALQSAPSQPSGNIWEYAISISCQSEMCEAVKISIPIPNAPTAAGSWTTWSPPRLQGDAAFLGGSTTVNMEVSNGNWVTTLSRPMQPGDSKVFTVRVSIPNLSTPNGFSWTLQPTVTGTGFGTVTTPPTAEATATATAVCTASISTSGSNILPLGAERGVSWFGQTGAGTTGALGVTAGTPVTYTVSYPSAALGYVSETHTVTGGPTSIQTVTPEAGGVVFGATQGADSSRVAWSGTVVLKALQTGPVTVSGTFSYTPVGETTPRTCSGSRNYSAVDAVFDGTVGVKSALGKTLSGDVTRVGQNNAANASYAPAAPVGSLAGSYFTLAVDRDNVSLTDLHVFDGLPCRSGQQSGTGASASSPLVSLAESEAPCTDPAFDLRVVWLSDGGGVLSDETFTFEYADGSSDVVSPRTTGTTGLGGTCSTNAPCYDPATGKSVASVIIDGTYDVNDRATVRSWRLLGGPADSLPTAAENYILNAATFGAEEAQSARTSWVGMVTPLVTSTTRGMAVTSNFLYSSGWAGVSSLRGCSTPTVNSACIGAFSSDPAINSQRRTAVVIPADSGVNVTNVSSYWPSVPGASASPVTGPEEGAFGGFGEGSRKYVVDASVTTAQAPYPASAGQGVQVAYGGMQPGVYTFYVYTGFTESDQMNIGTRFSCESTSSSQRGVLVEDTTGIIGEPGVPRELCRSTVTVIVSNPSAGINVTKSVRNVTDDGAWLSTPDGLIDAGPGDTVEYRVRVSNTSPEVLTNAAIYDILPHVGDTGITADQSSEPRGSTQTLPLASLPTAPDGWTLAMSDSVNPCRPEVGVPTGCDSTWASTLPASDVRSLRMTIPTLPVASAANPYYDLVIRYIMPGDASWRPDDIQWNTAAAGGTYGNLTLAPAETSKIGFGFVAPRLTVGKSLASARADDSDQFITEIRSGSASGTVELASPATTGTAGEITDGGNTGDYFGEEGDLLWVSERMADGSASVRGDYAATILCRDQAGVVPPAELPNGPLENAVSLPPLPLQANVACMITNRALRAELTVVKELDTNAERLRSGNTADESDGDQWTMTISDPISGDPLPAPESATTAGNGATITNGTTGAVKVRTDRSYWVGETWAGTPAGSVLDYTASMWCVDNNELTENLPTQANPIALGDAHAAQLPVALAPGSDVICTVVNAPRVPTIMVQKTLEKPRVDSGAAGDPADGDQFTVAIRDGAASGPILNSTEHSTTLGEAADVATGSGTTGTTSLTSIDDGIVITETVTGPGASGYDAFLTCTDTASVMTAAELPQGLMVDPEGGLTLNGMKPGAAVTCELRNVPAPPGLIVEKQLDAAGRINAADQFQILVREGGESGESAGDTSEDTTTGAGTAVSGGRVTLSPAGVKAYWLGEQMAGTGGSTAQETFPAAYKATVSCTASVDGSPSSIEGLPDAASPASLTEAGLLLPELPNRAQVTCAILNSARMTSVEVQKKGIDASDDVVLMPGSSWEVWTDASATPAAGVTVQPSSEGVFTIAGLMHASNYWLVETRAPSGFSVLSQPVEFAVDVAGSMSLVGSTSENISLANTADEGDPAHWVLTVVDIPNMLLPAAGGPGDLLIKIASGLLFILGLLLAGGAWMRRSQRRARAVLAAGTSLATSDTARPRKRKD